jgi:uncharacterized protein YjiS (DUF1127 family)
MTELAEMDDHMLRDLGIHRGEIEYRLRAQRKYRNGGRVGFLE